MWFCGGGNVGGQEMFSWTSTMLEVSTSTCFTQGRPSWTMLFRLLTNALAQTRHLHEPTWFMVRVIFQMSLYGNECIIEIDFVHCTSQWFVSLLTYFIFTLGGVPMSNVSFKKQQLYWEKFMCHSQANDFWSVFVDLYIHQHHQIPEHFPNPKETPCPLAATPFPT